MKATEANKLQEMWMKLDSTGPRSEIDRVCREYEKIPSSYIAQNANGICNVHLNGQPLVPRHGRATFDCSIQEAEQLAKQHGIQTTLRWNCAGEWFNHES